MILETITPEKIFKGVSDAELTRQYIETGAYKAGYCYNPELKSEIRRRRRERIREARKLKAIYNGLQRSTKDINLNFRIKVSGTRSGVKYNKLVGVSGLIDILGIELTNKLINRAFTSYDDKIICKLRTGLKVTFYSK